MLFSIPLQLLPLLFPQFLPRVSKLQSLRLAAMACSCLGGLAALRKAGISRGTAGLVSSSLLRTQCCSRPSSPFPRANTQVLLFGKPGLLWPAVRFLLFCPNYCVASYAETGFSWLLLLSEPETKRNRICLYPAQQMVVVIAKALINPPA